MRTSVSIDLLDLARTFAARPSDWPLAPRWDPARRWYHRLNVQPDHEAWLLTWLPGQGTDLHDHGPSAGAFVVVTGELAEQTAHAGGPRSGRYAVGGGRSFPRGHVHRIVNASDRPAVSVHVYGPALTAMTRYRWQAGALAVAGVERAGAQW